MSLPKTILVAVDFSAQSEKALELAVELARKLDARVHLVHGLVIPVVPSPEAGVALPPDWIESLERDVKRGLEELVRKYGDRGVPLETHLEWEDPRHAVVDAANRLKADLVVLGTHGRRGLKRALVGSVAESVVRFAPCPVLAVR